MFANLLITLKKLKSSGIFFLSFVLLLLSFSLQNSKLWHRVRHACSTSPGSRTSFLCCPCLCLIKARATCKKKRKKKKDSLFLQWGREEEIQLLAFLLLCQPEFLVSNVCREPSDIGCFIIGWQRLSVGFASKLCWVIRCQAYKVGSRDEQGHLVVQVSLSSLNRNYVFGFQDFNPGLRQGVGSGICALAMSLTKFLYNCPFL